MPGRGKLLLLPLAFACQRSLPTADGLLSVLSVGPRDKRVSLRGWSLLPVMQAKTHAEVLFPDEGHRTDQANVQHGLSIRQ